MYSCHSVLECSDLFSGVKLSIRSFCFIQMLNALLQHKMYYGRSYYLKRSSALDIKDTTNQRFGYSDVLLDLFIETNFLHLVALLSSFSKLFLAF